MGLETYISQIFNIDDKSSTKSLIDKLKQRGYKYSHFMYFRKTIKDVGVTILIQEGKVHTWYFDSYKARNDKEIYNEILQDISILDEERFLEFKGE